MIFRLAQPEALWGLALLPGIAWVLMGARRRRRNNLLKFAERTMLETLHPENFSWREKAGSVCLALAGLSLVAAGARPQWGSVETQRLRTEGDVMLVMDLSRSMEAADVFPTRLARAKRAVRYLLDRLPEHRFGLVDAAGTAWLQCPLTADHAAVALLLDDLSTSVQPIPGTDLGRAFRVAREALRRSPTNRPVMLLVSDGENFGSSPLAAIGQAYADGIETQVLGVGTPAGAAVPPAGPQNPGDKKSAGPWTRLNEVSLRQMAEQGGGTCQILTEGGQEEERLAAELNRPGSVSLWTDRLVEWQEGYPAAAVLAFFFLFLEGWLGKAGVPGRRAPRLKVWLMTAGIGIFLAGGRVWSMEPAPKADPAAWLGAFQGKNLAQEEKRLRAEVEKNPEDPRRTYNLGCIYLAEKKWLPACQMLALARRRVRGARLRDAWYNWGYSAFYWGLAEGNGGRWQEAAEAFKQVLRLDPLDEEARYNLEVVLRAIQHNQEPMPQPRPQGMSKASGTPLGTNPKQPGADRLPDSGQRSDQAQPGEEARSTREHNQSTSRGISTELRGPHQAGLSKEEALQTLHTLDAEERTWNPKQPEISSPTQTYRGPDW